MSYTYYATPADVVPPTVVIGPSLPFTFNVDFGSNGLLISFGDTIASCSAVAFGSTMSITSATFPMGGTPFVVTVNTTNTMISGKNNTVTVTAVTTAGLQISRAIRFVGSDSSTFSGVTVS